MVVGGASHFDKLQNAVEDSKEGLERHDEAVLRKSCRTCTTPAPSSCGHTCRRPTQTSPLKSTLPSAMPTRLRICALRLSRITQQLRRRIRLQPRPGREAPQGGARHRQRETGRGLVPPASAQRNYWRTTRAEDSASDHVDHAALSDVSANVDRAPIVYDRRAVLRRGDLWSGDWSRLREHADLDQSPRITRRDDSNDSSPIIHDKHAAPAIGSRRSINAVTGSVVRAVGARSSGRAASPTLVVARCAGGTPRNWFSVISPEIVPSARATGYDECRSPSR